MKKRLGIFICSVLMLAAAAVPAMADPPGESGPVERYDDFFFWGVEDADAGLLVFLGWDIRDWVCPPYPMPPDDMISFKRVVSPSNPDRIITTAKGEVRAYVWDLEVANSFAFCDLDPIATGTASVVLTDNDEGAWWYETGPNANAYGISAHGKLTNGDGERVMFSVHDRVVWDGDDPATFQTNSKVNLH